MLHTVAYGNDIDEAKRVIAQGADVNALMGNLTPLHMAASYGSKALVELLITHGAIVDPKGTLGFMPLHVAARDGHLAVAELLIARGANVNAETKDGITPLSLAIDKSHGDIVKVLRLHGAKK
jgi:ankyrin repeat protein